MTTDDIHKNCTADRWSYLVTHRPPCPEAPAEMNDSDQYMNQRLDPDQGRVEIVIYSIARCLGGEPAAAAVVTKDFITDAREHWTSDPPTRQEMYDSLERTVLKGLT